MVRKDKAIIFRVDSQTADAAKEKAEKMGISLSDILRQMLKAWLDSEVEFVIRRVTRDDK